MPPRKRKSTENAGGGLSKVQRAKEEQQAAMLARANAKARAARTIALEDRDEEDEVYDGDGGYVKRGAANQSQRNKRSKVKHQAEDRDEEDEVYDGYGGYVKRGAANSFRADAYAAPRFSVDTIAATASSDDLMHKKRHTSRVSRPLGASPSPERGGKLGIDWFSDLSSSNRSGTQRVHKGSTVGALRSTTATLARPALSEVAVAPAPSAPPRRLLEPQVDDAAIAAEGRKRSFWDPYLVENRHALHAASTALSSWIADMRKSIVDDAFGSTLPLLLAVVIAFTLLVHQSPIQVAPSTPLLPFCDDVSELFDDVSDLFNPGDECAPCPGTCNKEGHLESCNPASIRVENMFSPFFSLSAFASYLLHGDGNFGAELPKGNGRCVPRVMIFVPIIELFSILAVWHFAAGWSSSWQKSSAIGSDRHHRTVDAEFSRTTYRPGSRTRRKKRA